jgi:cellulose synthase operon protein C
VDAANMSSAATTRSDAINKARDLTMDGQLLDALDVLRQHGSLRDWEGADRVTVSRVVQETGAPRLGYWHVLRAFRESPSSLRVRNAYAGELLGDRGPLETLEFLEANAQPTPEDDSDDRENWFWLNLGCHTVVRDFTTAGYWAQRLADEGTRPEDVPLAKAQIAERQDRYNDAIELVDEAIGIRRGYRFLSLKARLLTLVDRDAEAYQLLAEADQEKQTANYVWQMLAIAYERRDYEDCARLLRRFDDLTPLRERAFGDAFLMLRSEIARRLGDDELAILCARKAGTSRGREIADLLADPQRRNATDIVLDVPFVRQHERTCGPATLASISRFWDMAVEHLEVVEEICYAGTSAHSERTWAEKNGFRTIEFTVDEQATETLISRGVPFTLVTRGAGYAHLQSVVGCDGRTRAVMIRDPYERTRGMGSITDFLESQAAYGPRGMALVPKAKAELLDDLQLPDAELHNLLHEFDGHLIEHRRDEAIKSLDRMRALAPDRFITLQTEYQLGIYDGNEEAMLAAVQGLLTQFPEDSGYLLSEVGLMGSLGHHRQRVERLQELVSKPQPHPLLILQLGMALSQDGRTRDDAETLMRRAIQKAPQHARAYIALGDQWFGRGRRAEAMRLYRFAASLEETDEYAANRYLDAGLATGQFDEVLQWLQNRFEKYSSKDMQPTITYVDALLRCRRYDDAILALESALQRRPDDGELKLYVAHTLSNLSSHHWDRAEVLLAEAKGAAPERGWRRTASHFCLLRGQLAEAKMHLETLLPRTPMAVGLHEEIADIVAQLEGPDAAIEYWQQAAEQFPHYIPLQESYAMALRSRPLEFIQPVLEQIIQANPDNSWAVRELAHQLMQAGKLPQAQQWILRADELDDENPFMANLKAMLAFRLGNVDEAKTKLRQAIEHNVNDDYSFSSLMNMCDSVEESRAELDFVYDRLCEHAVTGGIILSYQSYADAIIPAEELLTLLQGAQSARPDLWPTHQAVIRQLTKMQRFDEAQLAADKSIEQFPLEPTCWHERYQVAMAVGDLDTQLRVLEHLLVLRPGNATLLRALADLRVNLGQPDEAHAVLQELVAKQPLDAVNRGYLGDCLMELKDYVGAFDQFERAVRLEPSYSFAWAMLERTTDFLERPDVPEDLARELTEQRPHDAVPWLNLARYLGAKQHFEEAMGCLEKAEAINPYDVGVHFRRSQLLVSSGDYEGALASLSPPIFPQIPASLKLRRAQLLWDLGDHHEAYALAQQTATDDPAYLDAWQSIEQWAVLLGDVEAAKEAINKQIEINPSNPDILDGAGNRFMELDAPEQAIAAFRRAIEIAPSYTGSRCHLFDLLFEQGEIDEAEKVVSKIPRLDDHPVVIARRMKVADKRGNRDVVDACWQAILNSNPANAWAYNQAIEILEKDRPRASLAEPMLLAMKAAAEIYDKHEDENEQAIKKDADATLGVLGDQLISLRLPDSGALPQTTYQELVQQSVSWVTSESPGLKRAGDSAMAKLVTWLGKQDSLAQFYSVIRKHHDLLHQNANIWSTVAYLMADQPTRFSKRKIIAWVRAFDERTDLAPWMVTNIHELLRLAGREGEAKQLVLRALDMPADRMWSQLSLWAALDAIHDQNPRAAIAHFMQSARVENLEGNDKLLHLWVESVLFLLQSDEPRVDFEEVVKRLSAKEPDAKFFAKQPLYRKTYIRVASWIAKSAGTTKAKLWANRLKLRMFLRSSFVS